MEINIRKVGIYTSVEVVVNDVKHDLGLIETREVVELAARLAGAASELLEGLDAV